MSKEIKDIHYDPEIDKLVGELVEVRFWDGRIGRGILRFTSKNDFSGCPYELETNDHIFVFYKSRVKRIRKVR